MNLTPEEGQRLHVLTLLEGKRISVGQAAKALGVTPRQVRRLRVRLRREGPAALSHGNRGRPAPNRLPESLRAQIVALARGRYAGLNDHHLTECQRQFKTPHFRRSLFPRTTSAGKA